MTTTVLFLQSSYSRVSRFCMLFVLLFSVSSYATLVPEPFQATSKKVPAKTGQVAMASAIPMIRFTLYEDGALASSNTPADGFLVVFDAGYSNNVDENDAVKMTNLDENMGLANSGQVLSFESRSLPTAADVLPISLTQYRNTNYTYKIQINGIDGVEVYLIDKFLADETRLVNNGLTSISFQVNANDSRSMVENRFVIVFRTTAFLATEESNFAKDVKVYPNPVSGNQFNIMLPSAIEGNVSVKMVNLLGQQVYSNVFGNVQSAISVKLSNTLQSGIYLITITNGKKTAVKKIIIS